MYWKAMDMIEAQNTIDQIKAVSFPKLKERDQASMRKELGRRAFPKEKSESKPLSTEELRTALAAAINGG